MILDGNTIEKFRSLPPKKKIQFIDSLTYRERLELYNFPELFLYDKQVVKDGDWRYCAAICGRGFGKSYMGTAWIFRKILDGAKEIGMIGPTYSDLSKILIPQLIQWSPPNDRPKFNQKDNVLSYSNGAKVYCISSDTEVRGNNFEYLLFDEIGKSCDSIPEKIEEFFSVMEFAVRIGKHPQILITSTPKPMKFFYDFVKKVKEGNPLYKIMTGSMEDNPYLSKQLKQALLDKYSGTRLGRQELYGEILEDVEGALWSNAIIEDAKLPPIMYADVFKSIERIVIAVDPAVTSTDDSDETGIMVAGIAQNKVYILEDASGRYTPNEWAVKTVELYNKYKANCVVCETNQGGDLVINNLRTVSQNIPIKKIHAKRGKQLRAEPIAALYQQHKVFHLGNFVKLEYQMTHFTGDPRSKINDDRLDAMVYAVSELLIARVYTNRNFDNIGVY